MVQTLLCRFDEMRPAAAVLSLSQEAKGLLNFPLSIFKFPLLIVYASALYFFVRSFICAQKKPFRALGRNLKDTGGLSRGLPVFEMSKIGN